MKKVREVIFESHSWLVKAVSQFSRAHPLRLHLKTKCITAARLPHFEGSFKCSRGLDPSLYPKIHCMLVTCGFVFPTLLNVSMWFQVTWIANSTVINIRDLGHAFIDHILQRMRPTTQLLTLWDIGQQNPQYLRVSIWWVGNETHISTFLQIGLAPDWRPSKSASLAPLLPALSSQLSAKWINKLEFCSVLLAVAILRKNGNNPVVFVTAVPTMIPPEKLSGSTLTQKSDTSSTALSSSLLSYLNGKYQLKDLPVNWHN